MKGITANAERCRDLVLNSIGIVTVFTPIIGYEAAAIAKEASETGSSVQDIAMKSTHIESGKIAEIFLIENLINPKFTQQ